MAVKSAQLKKFRTLYKETQILSLLQDCPHVIRCYGDDVTFEDDHLLYNVLLEYASGGSLADRIASSPRGLPEFEVKRHTQLLLEGLGHIHRRGFVHYDIKPQNILLSSSSFVKIADFGLAKMVKENGKWADETFSLRGTPLYISPEAIVFKEHEPQSDIWALGCTVIEMLTGRPAWNWSSELGALLFKIGFSHELPKISKGISKEARSFVEKCLVKDAHLRWTTDMLLNHPFVAGTTTMVVSSPTSAFDFARPSFTQSGPSSTWGIGKFSKGSNNLHVCEDVIYLAKEDTNTESFIEVKGSCLSLESSSDLPQPNFLPKGSPDSCICQLSKGVESYWLFLGDWIAVQEAESPVYDQSSNHPIRGKRKRVEDGVKEKIELPTVVRRKIGTTELKESKCFPWILRRCAVAACRSIDVVPLGF